MSKTTVVTLQNRVLQQSYSVSCILKFEEIFREVMLSTKMASLSDSSDNFNSAMEELIEKLDDVYTGVLAGVKRC